MFSLPKSFVAFHLTVNTLDKSYQLSKKVKKIKNKNKREKNKRKKEKKKKKDRKKREKWATGQNSGLFSHFLGSKT